MPEPWDKDNPPEEFWGSSILSAAGTRVVFDLEANPSIASRLSSWFNYVQILLSIVLVVAIFVSDNNLLFAGLILLQVVLVLGEWPFLRSADRSQTAVINDSFHSLYYLFFEDTFRVRVESTGLARSGTTEHWKSRKEQIRFTQDDVRTLQLSELSGQTSLPGMPVRVIRLVFTLHDGEHYHHDHPLAPMSGEDGDHGRFLELLDRLEAYLGRDRIESVERLESARDAVKRSLQEVAPRGDSADPIIA